MVPAVTRSGLLACLSCALVLRPPSASAQAPGSHSVRGVVTDSTGTPITGAEVRLFVVNVAAQAVYSREDGSFTINGDMGGRSELRVRRMGFEPADVVLAFPRDSSRVLEIVLAEAVARLAGVEVREEASAEGWLHDFFERRRTNSFGHYYTGETLRASHVHRPSEILRRLPGIMVTTARRGGYVVRMRSCRYGPLVWLDGVRVPEAELDEVIGLEDIAGMEVYVATAGVPAQFMDRSNAGCGTIVIWTRHQ